MNKKILFVSYLVLTAGLAVAEEPTKEAPKIPPAFSGDKIVINKGQESPAGWVASDGKGDIHAEIGPGGDKKMIMIFNYQKKVAWQVTPNGNYMEIPMDLDKALKSVPKDIKMECGPGETIEGHPTKKCTYHGEYFGKQTTTDVWQATDLNDLPLKSLNKEGSGMRMANIKLGPQSANLFEEPKGQKTTNDQMMMQILQGEGKGKGMDPVKLQELLKAEQQRKR